MDFGFEADFRASLGTVAHDPESPPNPVNTIAHKLGHRQGIQIKLLQLYFGYIVNNTQ